MENMPEDRYTCKWCWYCECNEETTGKSNMFFRYW